MKIVTVFGTRPEIIRLSRVIAVLDEFCEHRIIHTGQNYDPNLSDVFFRDLGVRAPDTHLGVHSADFAAQTAMILERGAQVLQSEKPDRVLILGDTNSGLVSIVAARLQIPVFHMEAGNRAYDNRIPEEINRRVIDHCSDVLMPYTHRSKEALLREGIERRRIFVIGNPIFEVLEHYAAGIDASSILERLALQQGDFLLVTLHRSENVDEPARLGALLGAMERVADVFDKRVIVSVHPRTADRITRYGLAPRSPRMQLLEPLSFFDFVRLEKTAFCVMTDSGTVQEECCIFQVPNVTLRDVTERPETLECGSNILTGADPRVIERAVRLATTRVAWQVPPEYTVRNVSRTVANIVLGYTRRLQEC